MATPILERAEYEMLFSPSEIEKYEMALSQLERDELEQLSRLDDESREDRPFFKEILDVVGKGAIDYVDSLTDVSETLSEYKNPEQLSDRMDIEIERKNKPAAAGTESQWQTRTIKDASKNPFDKNVDESSINMSDHGKAVFERYKDAYNQRIKTVNSTSKDNLGVKMEHTGERNNSHLAGVSSYRFGPVVSPTPTSEMKKLFDSDVAAGHQDPANQANWVRKHNYALLRDKLQEDFGFKTRAQVDEFMKNHGLTPHEGPDGIYLVPSDIHDALYHSGYVSKMKKVLSGELSPQEMDCQIRKEKVALYKHEAKIRGVRAVKGAGLAVVKDFAKISIGILIRQTYEVFSKSDASFVENIRQIIRNVWEKIKLKAKSLWDNLKNGIIGSAVSEILTALNDFLFRTAKNIFKIVRMMWKSLYNAAKTIFSSTASWGERIFEAVKILSAGAVGVLGLSLTELIEKGLTQIGIPYSSVFADIFGGLFAGIMSALCLYIFDKARKKIFEQSEASRRSEHEVKILTIENAKIELAELKGDMAMTQAISCFGYNLSLIKTERDRIQSNLLALSGSLKETDYEISADSKLSDTSKLLSGEF